MKWKLNVARIQMGITISFIHFSGEYSQSTSYSLKEIIFSKSMIFLKNNLKLCQCIDVGVVDGSFYLQDPWSISIM